MIMNENKYDRRVLIALQRQRACRKLQRHRNPQSGSLELELEFEFEFEFELEPKLTVVHGLDWQGIN